MYTDHNGCILISRGANSDFKKKMRGEGVPNRVLIAVVVVVVVGGGVNRAPPADSIDHIEY